MDEKIKTWTLRFPAKENLNMETALFDWPIVLQYDVKAKFDWFLESSSGMTSFQPSFRLTNQTHERLYSFDKLIKSLYFCSFVVSETVLFARFYFKVIRKWLYTSRNCSWPGSLLGTRRSVRYWPVFFMSLAQVQEVLAT